MSGFAAYPMYLRHSGGRSDIARDERQEGELMKLGFERPGQANSAAFVRAQDQPEGVMNAVGRDRPATLHPRTSAAPSPDAFAAAHGDAIEGPDLRPWRHIGDALAHIRRVANISFAEAFDALHHRLINGEVRSRRKEPPSEGAPLGGWRKIEPDEWFEGADLPAHEACFGAGCPIYILSADLLKYWFETGNVEQSGQPNDALDAPPAVSAEPEPQTLKRRRGPTATAKTIQCAAKRLIERGLIPPKTIRWMAFQTAVCKEIGVNTKQRGYSLDTIQNAVRPLLGRAPIKESTESTDN